MSSIHNRPSNAKRSNSFLPDDIRKDLGGCLKKPRLDVRLTQLTPHSPNKLSPNAQVSCMEPAAEDEWEDLCEEAIEECVFLASQVCPEVNPQKDSSNDSAGRRTLETGRTTSFGFKAPVEVSRLSSNAKIHHKNISKPLSSRLDHQERSSGSMTNHSNIINSQVSDIQQTINKKLERESKTLQEKLLSKEGEVSILRSQLKHLQSLLDTQAFEHQKSIQDQAQKFKKQLSEQKKELDVTNTQLQFQIMEAATIRNHCKLLESSSKMKLIEPQAFSPNSRKKTGVFKEGHGSYSISGAHSSTGSGSSTVQAMNIKVNGSEINPNEFNIGIGQTKCREGSVLGKLINEFLFKIPVPDISWILYIREKQSLCKRIKEAQEINSKILDLQKNTRTLERCYTAVNQLITLDSTCSTAAFPCIITVFQECHEILCRQLHILQLLFDVQCHTERIVLNGDLPTYIGTLAGDPSNHLMSERPWYEDEEGIESRRALGLLCALSNVSFAAADLICGNSKLINELCSGSALRNTSIQTETLKKNIIINDPVAATSSNMFSVKPVNASNNEGQVKEQLNYSEYCLKHYGFLHLLRDIVFSISVQRTTKRFIGVLTGILKLLSSIVRSSTLTGDGLAVVAEIIREIVFCCPQVEVVVALFELLSLLSSYPAVMKSLCSNSDEKTFVDKRHIGLTYFTRDSCVIQVLYWLLPNVTTSISLRTQLCCHMAHWLFGMTCFLIEDEPWLVDLTENTVKRKCNCRRLLMQGLVTTVYNSICDLHGISYLGDQMKWEIHEALGKVIILLRVWLQQDKGFWRSFGQNLFGGQLMLYKIQTELSRMDLDAVQVECVNELLNGDTDPCKGSPFEGGDEDADHYWSTVSSECRSLFLE